MVLAWAPLTRAIYKLFLPPPDADAVYLGVWSFVLFTSGKALFMPYTAMGTEISPAYHQRSRIFLYRHLFAVVGTLVAAPLFVITNQSGRAFFPERDALIVLGVLFGVCPILFKLVALALVWRYPLTAARQAELRAEILARRGG